MKLDHVLILTTDLKVMTDFFSEVIGLQIGARPPFPFAGVWLYSEEQPLIHLAETPVVDTGAGPVAHIALSGADYPQLVRRLQSNQIAYYERDVPQSAQRQVFVCGPEGLSIELLFPAATVVGRPRPYTGRSHLI